jgi:ataxia telangiectasia mutated family protein
MTCLLLIIAEKSFAARCAVDVHPIDILNLLRTGLGLPIFRLPSRKQVPSGIIGQSWTQLVRQESMIRYLLLLEASPTEEMRCLDCIGEARIHESDRLSDGSAHGHSARRLILELFLPKFQLLMEDWESHGTEEFTRVSTDTLRSTASTCVLGCLLLSLITDANLLQLQEQLQGILKILTKFALAQLRVGVETQDLVESMLQAIQPYLPESNSAELAHLLEHNSKLHQLFDEVVDCLRLRQSVFEDVAIVRVDDPMDVDDMFDTQRSRPRESEFGEALARRDLSMALSPAAFYSTAMAQLVLVSASSKMSKANTGIPPGFVEYLVGLNPRETLLGRQVIRDILQSDLPIQRTDLPRLLEHIGEILSFPEYVCCEVALGLCLDVLTSLVSLWTNPEEGDVVENAIQLYEWLIDVVLPKRRPSPNVQMGLANLLSELMRVHPSYGETRQLPSVRTCLFEILQKGPIPVKFHIAEKLPNLFGLFVLKHHNGILIDLLPSLPSDPDWAEGIAFRLKVLGALASRWSTLIRLCTYYILEVPGRLSDSIKHATRCLADVSKALGLGNTRELFQLFASQLLYTWLASEPIEKFPFEIFGYKSLQEFVKDNQDEITALMTMRDQDDGVLNISHLLDVSAEELLQNCFSRIIAYSVAHDISIPHSANAKKYVTGEARIRKRLGKELFFDLVNRQFADIIALFFNLIDQEEQIVEKSFTKDPSLHYAAEALNHIKSMSSSEVALPPNQQPAFKARYLTSEIEHLCGRTEYEVADLYSPAMVVFIARHIINTIHPALGSLHTCAVLRKLRVLIALSGVTALQGYPIEMLLQAVRPFITDSECANDAIGITQYLLSRGSPHLSTSPSFVAGISLTILASLRAFLESSPASTTQQSQYRSTISKAQSFHMWLGSYLAEYNPTGLEGSSEAAFRKIIQSAHAFRAEGNADSETAESELLLELLDDERSGRRLLNKPSRTLGFSLLYNNFKQPTSFRNDVLGSDDSAVAFAPTIWNFCQDSPMNGSFLVWAAKIIGRAFAATGHIHQQLLQESGLRHIMEIGSPPLNKRPSKACLLQLLQNLTLGDNFQTAGLAEAVLRVIVTRPDTPLDDTETSICRESLSNSLYIASDWTPYHAPASDMLILQANAPIDPFGADSIAQPHWPRMLAISLVQSVPSETILYALQRLLRDAEGFAEEAFPFIVHLVLSLQFDGSQTAKRQLSKSLRLWLGSEQVMEASHIKLLMNTLLYLRAQSLPRETSSADRMHWLEVDYTKASEAAARCGMFKTALLFVEISVSESTRTSRRSSAGKSTEPQDILFLIFKHIDDPDIFYGLQQSASLATVLERLEYENDGMKSLAFRGAQYDVHLRRKDKSSTSDAQSLVNALGMLSLDGLSHSLLQSQQTISMDAHSMKRMFQTARKLEQWDLPMPASYDNEDFTMYRTFQAVNLSEDRSSIVRTVEEGLRSTLSDLVQITTKADNIHTSLQTLAALTEMDEVLSASSSEQFEEILARFHGRSHWMRTGK